MKKSCFLSLVCLFAVNLLFTACDQPGGGYSSSLINPGSSTTSTVYSVQQYKNAGATVAAKKGSTAYDCSNFSAQFYQNCYKKGLPCRVRLGTAGGSLFSSNENHAWNSVKINGKWVDWEPQLNDVYTGHTQTKTKNENANVEFTVEDIVRILYETVGKYVPENIIDKYELDKYLFESSPFYQYFLSRDDTYCLSDNQEQGIQAVIALLQEDGMKNNGSGNMYFLEEADNQQLHLAFFFRYSNKYYAMLNMDADDPLEGRSVTKANVLKEIIDSGAELIKVDIDLRY